MQAYAQVMSLNTDKTFYVKEDKIIFSGTVEGIDFGEYVTIVIRGPVGNFVKLTSALPDRDGNFQATVETETKFASHGIYNATAFIANETAGVSVVFDFSLDGSAVIPSAFESAPEVEEEAEPEPEQETESVTEPEQTPEPEDEQMSQVDTQTETEPIPPKIPGFPDPTKDPQYYVDRYNNEPNYKDWFDRNFPGQTIYEVVGAPEPISTKIPGFPDPNKDPQYYVDRYNNEPNYKDWFDRNFPDQTIYEVVGASPPEPEPMGICGPGTHLEDGVCIVDKKSGCLIATATYGSELAPQVQQLRELRDGVILKTNSGTAFMNGFNHLYYSFSPTIADWERQNPAFKQAVKLTITPLITSLSILNYVDIDSDVEMLGYGIGIILLNVGMYFVVPAFVILRLRRPKLKS